MTQLEEFTIILSRLEILPNNIYLMLRSLAELKNLASFELAVSDCRNIDRDCISEILIYVPSFPNLKEFALFAYRIPCYITTLSLDLQSSLKTAKRLRKLHLSLIDSISEKDGKELEEELKKKFSRIEIKIRT